MTKQPHLPGTEDGAIEALEDGARAYAEIRDERMRLNERESTLKAALIVLMHEHKKTIYHRHGVTITLVPEGEDVKVKIAKPKADPDVEVKVEPPAPPALGGSTRTH